MRRYDKENLLWQFTVAIRSDPVGSGLRLSLLDRFGADVVQCAACEAISGIHTASWRQLPLSSPMRTSARGLRSTCARMARRAMALQVTRRPSRSRLTPQTAVWGEGERRIGEINPSFLFSLATEYSVKPSKTPTYSEQRTLPSEVADLTVSRFSSPEMLRGYVKKAVPVPWRSSTRISSCCGALQIRETGGLPS